MKQNKNKLLTFHFKNSKLQLRFGLNNIKIDEKSYKDTLIYYIGYVTIKDLKYLKNNNVNPLYLIFGKVN